MDEQKRTLVTDASNRILAIEGYRGLIENLGHPESLVQLPGFLDTPGIAGTPLASELQSLLPDLRGPLMAAHSWKDLARRLRDLLLGQKIEVLGQGSAWLPLEVHVLYRPQVPGARAGLTVSSEREESETCNLEFFGTGGGSEHVVRLAVSDSLETDSNSVAAIYQLRSTWERCRISQPGGGFTSFMRLKSINRECRRVEVRDIEESSTDPNWGTVVAHHSFDLRGGSATLMHTLTLERGMKWEGKVGASVEGLGVKCEAAFRGTRNWRSELTFKLVSGYLYEVCRFEHRPHWWWRDCTND